MVLGKRTASGGLKRRITPFSRPGGRTSAVGVTGAGPGSVRYAGRDYYGSIASLTTDSTVELGLAGTGLNPLRNAGLFERINTMVKGFAQYRFSKFNIILKGQGGTSKGTISFCYFHNDNKGGNANISNETSVKASGSGFTIRADQNGIFRCKQDREWLGVDTNIGVTTANTSPGTVYYFTQGTVAAADCEWDVWIDYVIELKDPARLNVVN